MVEPQERSQNTSHNHGTETLNPAYDYESDSDVYRYGGALIRVTQERDAALAEVDRLTAALAAERDALRAGEASDGHHTHNELYNYRLLYNAAAVNAWAAAGTYPVVKSWRHSDGEECFGGGWFIVVATLPMGQTSNHYQAEHWDMFLVPAVAMPPDYDGHTPAEAADRIRAALAGDTKEGGY